MCAYVYPSVRMYLSASCVRVSMLAFVCVHVRVREGVCVNPSVCLSVCLSACMFVRPNVCSYMRAFINACVRVFLHARVCEGVWVSLSISLSVCMSTCMFLLLASNFLFVHTYVHRHFLLLTSNY